MQIDLILGAYVSCSFGVEDVVHALAKGLSMQKLQVGKPRSWYRSVGCRHRLEMYTHLATAAYARLCQPHAATPLVVCNW